MPSPVAPLVQLVRTSARWTLNRLAARLAPPPKIAPGSGGQPFPLAVAFRDALSVPPGPDILFFGDSVALRVSRSDGDRRALPDMLRAELPGHSLHAVAFSAYTAHMFEPFLALARRMGAAPAHVILPLNLRCLSPQWDLCPMWQYGQDRAVIDGLVIDPEGTIPPKIPVLQQEEAYEAVAFASPLSDHRTIGDFRRLITGRFEGRVGREERNREILVYHYGMPARQGHRQILFFRAALRGALALGARPVAYLTPVNIGFVREAGGEALVDILRNNARLVRAAAAEEGVAMLDWSEAFDPASFFHPREMTEHLCEAGRRDLARRIADAVAGVR